MTIIQDQDYYPESVTTVQQGSRWRRDLLAAGIGAGVGVVAGALIAYGGDEAQDPSIAPGAPVYSCQDYPYEEDCVGG